MKNLLLAYLKKLFSDFHNAIIAIILVSIIAGGGSVYLFFESQWILLRNTILSPTPLWTTIVLALVFYIYAHLRIKLIHSKETPNINIDDYDQPQKLGGISQHKKTNKIFCTSCLIKNIKSPLFINPDGYYWKCPLKDCNKSYKNPSKELPIPKTPGYSFQQPDN